MASYEYRVEIAETINGRVEWWAVGREDWTHEDATRYVHEDLGREYDYARRARIVRRRGPRSRWTSHRAYSIANGVATRTDR